VSIVNGSIETEEKRINIRLHRLKTPSANRPGHIQGEREKEGEEPGDDATHAEVERSTNVMIESREIAVMTCTRALTIAIVNIDVRNNELFDENLFCYCS
jgi:hypothetical protein